MPAPSRRWLISLACAAAGLALAGLSAAPAAAARDARSAAARASAGQASRSNVGATHSPQLLRQLSGASGSAPLTGAGQMAPGVTPSAAVAGDEQGVDVASFQHPGGAAIDWPQVAASGVGFAGVKATEGNYYKNPYALTDLAGAQAAGLSVVAYAFAIPNGDGTAGSNNPVNQADYLLQSLGSASRTVPLMLDIEYDPYYASDGTNQCYGLTPASMVSWIAAFEGEVQAKTGRLPIIYTPPSWWSTCTGKSAAFGHTPVWVPDINSSGSPLLPAGWTTWSLWQYASSGTVNGISGTTDLDQANPASLALLNFGTRKQANGDPVGLQLLQAVPPPGQSLSFTATGLPAGLSMTSSGRISGWLTHAGTYWVQVSVAGSGGAAGSASFSWAVSTPASQGPTGPIRFDAGGQCLNDAGNSSANGTRINIQPCNGSAAQQWTGVQDRTLRIHGKCLSVSGSAKVDGSKTVLEPCAGYASQQWAVGSVAQLVNGTAGKCLAGSSTGFSGTQDWISSCNGKANQKWTLPAGPVVSEIPGLCVDDKSDSTANGNPVVMWTCDGHAAQQWTVKTDGTVRLAGKCLDIPSSGTASGTMVDLHSCGSGSAGQQWRISAGGGGAQLENPASGLCLADPGDVTSNGTAAVVAACAAGDPGQVWRLR